MHGCQPPAKRGGLAAMPPMAEIRVNKYQRQKSPLFGFKYCRFDTNKNDFKPSVG